MAVVGTTAGHTSAGGTAADDTAAGGTAVGDTAAGMAVVRRTAVGNEDFGAAADRTKSKPQSLCLI